MPKLTPTSYNELVKKLRMFGFEGPYGGGKHLYMVKGSLRLTIPNPHRKEISIDLLTGIIRQAGITKNDWIKNEV